MRRGRYFGITLIYGLLFLASLYLAVFFFHISGVSLWYPAAGLRLAVFLVLGWRFAPGVIAAEIAAVILYGILHPSTGFATLTGVIGASLMPVIYCLAAFALTRYVDLDIRLRRFRDMAWIATAAMIVPLLTAVANRLWQLLIGRLTAESFLHSLVGFWIGDTIGILMLTPLLLVWHRYRVAGTEEPQPRLSGPAGDPRPARGHLLVDFALIWIFLILIYRLPGWLEDFASNVHWYLAFLPVIWISFRHGLIGSIAGVLAIASGAAWLTSLPVQSARFHELQIFVMFLALTALLVGSVVSAMLTTEQALMLQNLELKDTRAQLEDKNIELEIRNAELERFTYAASHDLKSPLVTIHGFLGMLEKDVATGATERMQDDMQRIRSATGRMSRLLDELTELSRVGRLIEPAVEVSLDELVAEALEANADQIAACRMKVEVSPRLPIVFGDRLRLLEVLRNLIENAVHFTAGEPDPRLEIGVRDGGSESVIFVRDNGIGIDQRYRERIFRLFEKLNPQYGEGTGVGLALVRRIIEMHGGRVWVESEGLGHGSTFCFSLQTPVTES